jgi:hypothetical protein
VDSVAYYEKKFQTELPKGREKSIGRLVGTPQSRGGGGITSSNAGDQGRVRKQQTQIRINLKEESTSLEKRMLISLERKGSEQRGEKDGDFSGKR